MMPTLGLCLVEVSPGSIMAILSVLGEHCCVDSGCVEDRRGFDGVDYKGRCVQTQKMDPMDSPPP